MQQLQALYAYFALLIRKRLIFSFILYCKFYKDQINKHNNKENLFDWFRLLCTQTNGSLKKIHSHFETIKTKKKLIYEQTESRRRNYYFSCVRQISIKLTSAHNCLSQIHHFFHCIWADRFIRGFIRATRKSILFFTYTEDFYF